MKLGGFLLVGAVVVIALAAVGFFLYSFDNAFKNWPWTRKNVLTQGSILGISVGAPKAEVVAVVMTEVRNGRLSSIESLKVGDPAVPLSDHWFVGRFGCNCWLELHFENGKLIRIVSTRYYGPTL